MEPRIAARIESWALSIVDSVQQGKKVEDSRVELKREWPTTEKGARRVAGHANAAFGAEILWIIGLDEKAGVVGVNPPEMANWWKAVQAQFDGVAPSMVVDLRLEVDGKTLWALVFDTSRAPFVVKNPDFGKGPTPIALEVPWREGTSVRTATRNDLLRMLVPVSERPSVEILNGGLTSSYLETYPASMSRKIQIWIYFTIYLAPRKTPVVIPFHRCKTRIVHEASQHNLENFSVNIYAPMSFSRPGSGSVTLQTTDQEAIFQGPGQCSFRASIEVETLPEWMMGAELNGSVELAIVDSPSPVSIHALFAPAQIQQGANSLGAWNMRSVQVS